MVYVNVRASRIAHSTASFHRALTYINLAIAIMSGNKEWLKTTLKVMTVMNSRDASAQLVAIEDIKDDTNNHQNKHETLMRQYENEEDTVFLSCSSWLIRDKNTIISFMIQRAEIYQGCAQMEKADRCLKRALSIADERDQMCACHMALGRHSHAKGRFRESVEWYMQVLTLYGINVKTPTIPPLSSLSSDLPTPISTPVAAPVISQYEINEASASRADPGPLSDSKYINSTVNKSSPNILRLPVSILCYELPILSYENALYERFELLFRTAVPSTSFPLPSLAPSSLPLLPLISLSHKRHCKALFLTDSCVFFVFVMSCDCVRIFVCNIRPSFIMVNCIALFC